jgi:hypothetical protein
VINAIQFSIEEIEASDQYFDHTGAESFAVCAKVFPRGADEAARELVN